MRVKIPFSLFYRTLLTSISILFLSVQCFAQARPSKEEGPDMTILADSSILTKGDYLVHLQKVFETVNKVPVTVGAFTKLKPIEKYLTRDEAALTLLKNRLKQSDRMLNLQNLQMDQTLLEQVQANNVKCLADLDEYEKELRALKTEILSLRGDTVLKKLFTLPAMRLTFKEQFAELKIKGKVMDSLLKTTTTTINDLQARTSANLINIKELMYLTDNQLDAVSIRAFSKERRYLWEPSTNKKRGPGFSKLINSEKEVSEYYFVYTRSSRAVLLFTCLIFFSWVAFNFRSMKHRDRTEALQDFYLLNQWPVLLSFTMLFTLAPIFDLKAPAIYLELVRILLALTLTAFFRKKLNKKMFGLWCVFSVLLVAPVVTRLLGMTPGSQRWMLLLLSTAAAVSGLFALRKIETEAKKYKFIVIAGIIYTLLAFAALFCNVFGRVTLAQIFYGTGVNALLNAISLTILAKVLVQTFLLQMKSSRIRKGYPEYFDWHPVSAGLKRFTGIVVIAIWLVIFCTNLNIFNGMYESLMEILLKKRIVGNFSFTFGGILLFLGIIWTANFLQKYIAYFFGDTGDDSLEDNKGERSKLLITRLVLLIGGFLIAVAASGLPIDKITVILGALGVGIGLGLQNIVSNFVSGIILIFDKTIRIGDVVELSSKKGRVKEIGVRASTLLTDEGAEIIIPNGSILSNNIINWTLSNNQMRVDIGLKIAKPFNSSEIVNQIREIIISNDNVFVNKEPVIMISPVSKSNSNIKIYFWCKNIAKADLTRSLVIAQIFEDLSEKDIELV